MNLVRISHEIDTDALQRTIHNALKLEDNQELFEQLTAILKAKKDITDLLEQVERIERDAKRAINAKAQQLYGRDWQAIAGKGWKITRYFAGSVYARIEGEKVPKQFVKVVENLDTKAIDAYLEANEKLPKGLQLNNDRTEVIKVTLK